MSDDFFSSDSNNPIVLTREEYLQRTSSDVRLFEEMNNVCRTSLRDEVSNESKFENVMEFSRPVTLLPGEQQVTKKTNSNSNKQKFLPVTSDMYSINLYRHDMDEKYLHQLSSFVENQNTNKMFVPERKQSNTTSLKTTNQERVLKHVAKEHHNPIVLYYVAKLEDSLEILRKSYLTHFHGVNQNEGLHCLLLGDSVSDSNKKCLSCPPQTNPNDPKCTCHASTINSMFPVNPNVDLESLSNTQTHLFCQNCSRALSETGVKSVQFDLIHGFDPYTPIKPHPEFKSMFEKAGWIYPDNIIKTRHEIMAQKEFITCDLLFRRRNAMESFLMAQYQPKHKVNWTTVEREIYNNTLKNLEDVEEEILKMTDRFSLLSIVIRLKYNETESKLYRTVEGCERIRRMIDHLDQKLMSADKVFSFDNTQTIVRIRTQHRTLIATILADLDELVKIRDEQFKAACDILRYCEEQDSIKRDCFFIKRFENIFNESPDQMMNFDVCDDINNEFAAWKKKELEVLAETWRVVPRDKSSQIYSIANHLKTKYQNGHCPNITKSNSETAKPFSIHRLVNNNATVTKTFEYAKNKYSDMDHHCSYEDAEEVLQPIGAQQRGRPSTKKINTKKTEDEEDTGEKKSKEKPSMYRQIPFPTKMEDVLQYETCGVSYIDHTAEEARGHIFCSKLLGGCGSDQFFIQHRNSNQWAIAGIATEFWHRLVGPLQFRSVLLTGTFYQDVFRRAENDPYDYMDRKEILSKLGYKLMYSRPECVITNHINVIPPALREPTNTGNRITPFLHFITKKYKEILQHTHSQMFHVARSTMEMFPLKESSNNANTISGHEVNCVEQLILNEMKIVDELQGEEEKAVNPFEDNERRSSPVQESQDYAPKRRGRPPKNETNSKKSNIEEKKNVIKSKSSKKDSSNLFTDNPSIASVCNMLLRYDETEYIEESEFLSPDKSALIAHDLCSPDILMSIRLKQTRAQELIRSSEYQIRLISAFQNEFTASSIQRNHMFIALKFQNELVQSLFDIHNCANNKSKTIAPSVLEDLVNRFPELVNSMIQRQPNPMLLYYEQKKRYLSFIEMNQARRAQGKRPFPEPTMINVILENQFNNIIRPGITEHSKTFVQPNNFMEIKNKVEIISKNFNKDIINSTLEMIKNEITRSSIGKQSKDDVKKMVQMLTFSIMASVNEIEENKNHKMNRQLINDINMENNKNKKNRVVNGNYHHSYKTESTVIYQMNKKDGLFQSKQRYCVPNSHRMLMQAQTLCPIGTCTMPISAMRKMKMAWFIKTKENLVAATQFMIEYNRRTNRLYRNYTMIVDYLMKHQAELKRRHENCSDWNAFTYKGYSFPFHLDDDDWEDLEHERVYPSVSFILKANGEIRPVQLPLLYGYSIEDNFRIDELEIGDVMFTDVVEGSTIIFTRAPAIWRMNVLALKIIKSKNEAIGINQREFEPLGGDLDGDHDSGTNVMPTIAIVDCQVTMTFDYNPTDMKNGAFILGTMQDSTLGIFLLSMLKKHYFTLAEVQEIVNHSNSVMSFEARHLKYHDSKYKVGLFSESFIIRLQYLVMKKLKQVSKFEYSDLSKWWIMEPTDENISMCSKIKIYYWELLLCTFPYDYEYIRYEGDNPKKGVRIHFKNSKDNPFFHGYFTKADIADEKRTLQLDLMKLYSVDVVMESEDDRGRLAVICTSKFGATVSNVDLFMTSTTMKALIENRQKSIEYEAKKIKELEDKYLNKRSLLSIGFMQNAFEKERTNKKLLDIGRRYTNSNIDPIWKTLKKEINVFPGLPQYVGNHVCASRLSSIANGKLMEYMWAYCHNMTYDRDPYQYHTHHVEYSVSSLEYYSGVIMTTDHIMALFHKYESDRHQLIIQLADERSQQDEKIIVSEIKSRLKSFEDLDDEDSPIPYGLLAQICSGSKGSNKDYIANVWNIGLQITNGKLEPRNYGNRINIMFNSKDQYRLRAHGNVESSLQYGIHPQEKFLCASMALQQYCASTNSVYTSGTLEKEVSILVGDARKNYNSTMFNHEKYIIQTICYGDDMNPAYLKRIWPTFDIEFETRYEKKQKNTSINLSWIPDSFCLSVAPYMTRFFNFCAKCPSIKDRCNECKMEFLGCLLALKHRRRNQARSVIPCSWEKDEMQECVEIESIVMNRNLTHCTEEGCMDHNYCTSLVTVEEAREKLFQFRMMMFHNDMSWSISGIKLSQFEKMKYIPTNNTLDIYLCEQMNSSRVCNEWKLTHAELDGIYATVYAQWLQSRMPIGECGGLDSLSSIIQKVTQGILNTKHGAKMILTMLSTGFPRISTLMRLKTTNPNDNSVTVRVKNVDSLDLKKSNVMERQEQMAQSKYSDVKNMLQKSITVCPLNSLIISLTSEVSLSTDTIQSCFDGILPLIPCPQNIGEWVPVALLIDNDGEDDEPSFVRSLHYARYIFDVREAYENYVRFIKLLYLWRTLTIERFSFSCRILFDPLIHQLPEFKNDKTMFERPLSLKEAEKYFRFIRYCVVHVYEVRVKNDYTKWIENGCKEPVSEIIQEYYSPLKKYSFSQDIPVSKKRKEADDSDNTRKKVKIVSSSALDEMDDLMGEDDDEHEIQYKQLKSCGVKTKKNSLWGFFVMKYEENTSSFQLVYDDPSVCVQHFTYLILSRIYSSSIIQSVYFQEVKVKPLDNLFQKTEQMYEKPNQPITEYFQKELKPLDAKEVEFKEETELYISVQQKCTKHQVLRTRTCLERFAMRRDMDGETAHFFDPLHHTKLYGLVAGRNQFVYELNQALKDMNISIDWRLQLFMADQMIFKGIPLTLSAKYNKLASKCLASKVITSDGVNKYIRGAFESRMINQSSSATWKTLCKVPEVGTGSFETIISSLQNMQNSLDSEMIM
jgi:hypothetical protein